MGNYRIGVVGATGAVGTEIITLLEERKFPVQDLRCFASMRSAGERISFQGNYIRVEALRSDLLTRFDFVFFAAGSEVSREFVPVAKKSGAIVIDNSKVFRMDPDVPLVVPEVNPEMAHEHDGLIANPNCSTIQLVVVLKPLHDFARIKRVVVSTYQATSGKGRRAMEELSIQTACILNAKPFDISVFPHQIAFNCLPHIDDFDEEGYSVEERKMIRETQKIMNDPNIALTATTVRVPVFNGHSESVNIETERKLTANQARDILSRSPGVQVWDDPQQKKYPMNIDAGGKDDVFVGRIREDFSIERGLNLWIVADNLRKGAALNAVQIAEILIL